jgi:nucleoside-diphosphate-sugar epimerase
VIFLAALSNDALGNLDPQLTFQINLDATVKVAERAKEAGVGRFLFSSSCSLYGAGADEHLTEEAPFNPVTPYGEAKIKVEQQLTKLAGGGFSPVYLRNATAYGVSPSLRGDLVVNNLVGYALTTGEVLIKSDGSPWRPLVHIEDISRAFLAVLDAPTDVIHDQAFNVGVTEENYRIREVAEIVRKAVPGSRVEYAPGASPDIRNYRVDFSKIKRCLPAFRPVWTVAKGVDELHAAYKAHGLTREEFLGSRYLRIGTILERRKAGLLDEHLRWRA